MKLLTAIPVYNEERHLEGVLREVRRYCPNILVIDDGSTDRTPELLAREQGIRVLTHPKNRGYGAALLLDSWALLGRQDLRAAEDTLRRWMAAAALVRPRDSGGVVVVVAESSVPTVQSLIRWDPVGHAEAELAARTEVALPPSVHMAALDGPGEAVTALLEEIRLPDSAELLGPVPLPVGARRPPGIAAEVPVSRMLVRVHREQGLALVL